MVWADGAYVISLFFDCLGRLNGMSQVDVFTKFSYGFGQIAEGIKTSAFGLFLLFYYNQVLGVSGSLCAIALFVAMCVDAVSDPIMGSVSDNWRSRLGRRHPFMYFAALPLAGGFYLLFNPMVTSEIALFWWLMIVAVVLRIMLTLYHVPHLALGAELSNDYKERTTLVAIRNAFGAVGYILVYALGFGIFFVASEEFPNGQLNKDAYPPFTILLALLMLVSVLVMAFGTQKAAARLPVTSPSSSGLGGLLGDVREALRNRSFFFLVSGFIVISMPIGIGTSLALYLNTYFWQISPTYMPAVLIIGPLATMIGYLFAPFVANYLEKKQALIWGGVGWVIFYTSPVVLYYLGAFPEPGTMANVVALVIFHFIAGLVVSQLIVAVGAMLADISDEHDLVTGKRSEGVFFGAYAFIIKATAGIGAATSGIVLDFIEWPAGDHIRTAADVSQDALFSLSLVAGPFLALGLLPALYFFSKYRLTRARHAEILTELRARA
ncbi:MAG: hypothetical protein GKR90_09655 [Pseudomonadales bacterium]|nr:hypothetical protein [Pseudomonadales bacterium]